MPELVDPIDKLQVELEQLRRSESQLKDRQVLLLRLALSQQDPAQSFEDKLRTFTKEVGNFLELNERAFGFLTATTRRCVA